MKTLNCQIITGRTETIVVMGIYGSETVSKRYTLTLADVKKSQCRGVNIDLTFGDVKITKFHLGKIIMRLTISGIVSISFYHLGLKD